MYSKTRHKLSLSLPQTSANGKANPNLICNNKRRPGPTEHLSDFTWTRRTICKASMTIKSQILFSDHRSHVLWSSRTVRTMRVSGVCDKGKLPWPVSITFLVLVALDGINIIFNLSTSKKMRKYWDWRVCVLKWSRQSALVWKGEEGVRSLTIIFAMTVNSYSSSANFRALAPNFKRLQKGRFSRSEALQGMEK